jgi:hypothetical protein
VVRVLSRDVDGYGGEEDFTMHVGPERVSRQPEPA